ncbi:helix-turn-helix domain-containing protein [Microlunatus sp. GCM10028923]|uniref:helix-turn-helix domain-containing protein n=1 Tax=Microlunatus sp. GCM10028923 TaxID=3273400 RepID=UPI003608FD09
MISTAEQRPVGPLLRQWRERRRFSQQELSDRSDISTRHVSRVETGKAHPTAEMIIRLADHLEVPLRDRNRLLLAAGYAPRYQDQQLDSAGVSVVMDGLRRLLDAHLPYPALLLDDHWDVIDSNAGVEPLLAGCAPELLEPPINVIRLSVHPDGLAPRIVNFDDWAAHLYHQLVARAERTHDPRLEELAGEVGARVRPSGGASAAGPVLALELAVDHGVLRLFSISSRLTTAADATLEGLHLETFVPADDETRRRFATTATDAGS